MNKFKEKYLTVAMLASVAITAVLSTTAMAAGGTPNGRPFVVIGDMVTEVQGAITTLEDQVAELIGKVDSIEGRLAANEQAIGDLVAENEAMDFLVVGALTSIGDINAEIETLSGDIEANAGLITTLQGAIASVVEGQIDLEGNLQDQIDNNIELIGILRGNIEAINDFLETDQHITEGTCSDGEYVIGHTADSVSCAPVDGGGGSSVITSYFTYARSVSYGRNIKVYCHRSTDIATGGGFNAIQTNHTVRRSTPTGVNGWTVELTGNLRDIQAYVMCLRVN